MPTFTQIQQATTDLQRIAEGFDEILEGTEDGLSETAVAAAAKLATAAFEMLENLAEAHGIDMADLCDRGYPGELLVSRLGKEAPADDSAETIERIEQETRA